MKKRYAVLCVIAMAALIAGCGKSTSSGKVLAEVNGDKITEGDIEFLGQINPRIHSQIASPDGRQRIIDNLVEQNLLYQEAVKEGVNRDPIVKAKIDLYRRVIIAQALVEKEIENSAKKYYDANPEEFKKLKLSQILVRYASPDDMKKAKKAAAAKIHSEEEALKIANELKARLDKGEAFDVVAKDASEDPITKARGGDLGLVSKNDKRLEARGYAPLLEKAFGMKVGEVAGPIKTQDGYSIITVTRGVEVEPFDEAKQAILTKVRGDGRTELLARLKKDAKIEIAGKPEKPGEAAAPAPGGAPVAPGAGIEPDAEAGAAAEKPAAGTPMTIKIGDKSVTVPTVPAGVQKEAPAKPAAAPEAKKDAPAKTKP